MGIRTNPNAPSSDPGVVFTFNFETQLFSKDDSIATAKKSVKLISMM